MKEVTLESELECFLSRITVHISKQMVDVFSPKFLNASTFKSISSQFGYKIAGSEEMF